MWVAVKRAGLMEMQTWRWTKLLQNEVTTIGSHAGRQALSEVCRRFATVLLT